MSFLGEVRRRKVFQVTAVYAVVAWLLVQVATTVSGPLGLPGWFDPAVIVLLSLGFPVTVILSWAFELTPEGLVREEASPARRKDSRKLEYSFIGLLTLAVAFLLADRYFLGDSGRSDAAEAESAARRASRIVVLPFTNLSSDAEQEFFADGLSEELANTIGRIPDLSVIGRTSSFAFKGESRTVQEIAAALGVQHLLDGSVRKSGNRVRITAQLIRAADSEQLWSDVYERDIENIFGVQEEIASVVAEELSAALGIGETLRRGGGTQNVEAYELYLGALASRGLEPFDHALELIDSAIAMDPAFALAWATKAAIHHGRSIVISAERMLEEQAASLAAAERAIELEPTLGEARAYIATASARQGEWEEAEREFRAAYEASPSPTVAFQYAIHQRSVGNFARAYELLRVAKDDDPLDQNLRAFWILDHAYTGRMQGADAEFETGSALFGGDRWAFGAWMVTLARLGAGGVTTRTTRDEIPLHGPEQDLAREYLDSPEEGLAQLRRVYAELDDPPLARLLVIALWTSYFGDTELAMDIWERITRADALGAQHFWVPALRELRQTPRFKQLIGEIGLVEYWNEFGWPDICRPIDGGELACD